ncbi:SDR family NAD(P)-dependent oxidoreductase [Natronosporangium hydrolyticum]|uniref:SDR family NAD(P)-dependent oxidoreductase n=1 Tax=Natronosporangium hydrolyticum TaxID=2811111 RepID=A0A895YBR9_9ACTN|nr:SDR family NAD(P)-dependent oxidoreductase [Natronosporangium hydrolyticum]QSB13715.1 SDR family NAD(P)-dependent oxidoreductase [Natronosporangium hydrolyticum]
MTRATALITGASGGLGAAVSAHFLAQGWRVVAPVRPGTAPARIPDGVSMAAADLTDPDAVGATVELATAARTAPLRAVVNLVGGFQAGRRVHETPLADFEAMLTLNLRPTYLVTAAALPHLVTTGAGAVVCVSAQAATRPFTGAAGYVTAKAAVLAFANAVAVEYQPAGVRSNTVLPGVIDTPGNRRAMPDADRSGWVAPADLARVIHFLASDESAPTTGAALPVTV